MKAEMSAQLKGFLGRTRKGFGIHFESMVFPRQAFFCWKRSRQSMLVLSKMEDRGQR